MRNLAVLLVEKGRIDAFIITRKIYPNYVQSRTSCFVETPAEQNHIAEACFLQE